MSACVETVFPAVSPIAVSRPASSTVPSQANPAARSRVPLPNVVHVALDSFFASVEQALNPKLLGRPVLVGRKGLASISAEAKMMGVRPTMTVDEALEICPRAVVVPGRYNKYAEYAERVRRILETYSPNVDASSRDDFYLDFTEPNLRNPDLRDSLLRLQMDVFDQTRLSVSVGAASSRVVAEIASQADGPRGFRVVPVNTEQEFIAPLAVERMPRIGWEHTSLLESSGVNTIAALRRVPRPSLEAAFGGVLAGRIWNAARGRDGSEKLLTAPRRSISRETVIDAGTIDPEHLNQMIGYLCDRIGLALRESGSGARSICLAIAYVDQYSARQSTQMAKPSGTGSDLQEAARNLCKNLFTRQVRVSRIRVEVSAGAAKTIWSQQCADAPELAVAASL